MIKCRNNHTHTHQCNKTGPEQDTMCHQPHRNHKRNSHITVDCSPTSMGNETIGHQTSLGHSQGNYLDQSQAVFLQNTFCPRWLATYLLLHPISRCQTPDQKQSYSSIYLLLPFEVRHCSVFEATTSDEYDVHFCASFVFAHRLSWTHNNLVANRINWPQDAASYWHDELWNCNSKMPIKIMNGAIRCSCSISNAHYCFPFAASSEVNACPIIIYTDMISC